ncbi:Uncharacterised protein [Mycobacteroides abscessus subsp. massiliense]|nr:Uncharacterised protein [Mycobacteroides abscessus subsp. massiliense]
MGILEQFRAEVPHTGEGGDAVIPTDHDAKGGNGIQQGSVGEQADNRVERRGDDAGHHGAERGGEEAGADTGEPFRKGAVGAHGEHRACGGKRGGLQTGDRRGEYRQQ